MRISISLFDCGATFPGELGSASALGLETGEWPERPPSAGHVSKGIGILPFSSEPGRPVALPVRSGC